MQKNFTNKNLKDLDFLGKKIKLKVLNSTLKNCNFWEANIANSNFDKTTIQNCVFTDAVLNNVSFHNTVIKNSNFSHSNLSNCDFSKTKLVKVNFRDVVYNNKTKWPKNFNLKNINFLEEKKFNPFDYKIKMSLNQIKNTSSKKIKEFKRNFLKKIKKEKKLTSTQNKIIYELTKGKGYYIIKNYYKKNLASKAENIIKRELIKKNSNKIKKDFSIDKKFKSINIYGLLNLDPIFRKLIRPNILMGCLKKIMGDDFICTFYAAQCSLAGCRGQILHLDYPYVVYNKPGQKLSSAFAAKDFLFSIGVLTFINEYDKNYAGPILAPGTHKLRRFPTIEDTKTKKLVKVKVPRGGILIINSMIWHSGMPNYSKSKDRHLIVAHYTPSFIKRRYDLLKETKKKFVYKDKDLKKLIS